MLFTSMDVSYGGDRYRTFEGNEEVSTMETTITLNFEEIELITRKEIIEVLNMYFDNFPTIFYDSELTGQFKDVKNLLRMLV